MLRWSSAVVCAALCVAVLSSGVRLSAQEAAKPVAKPAALPVGDAIQASAEAFAQAYNAHDAKSLANLFLPESLVYDEDAKLFQGREQITAAFTSVFEATPEVRIELAIGSVEAIGPTMAVETGVSTTTSAPDAIPERARYVALHVLRDGVWKIALIRDMPAESSPGEQLLPLAWLVGEWVDESRSGHVSTVCRWDDSRCYLLQEITVHRGGRSEMKISQRIGWDPQAKTIKAWMFDSEGGFGESVWTPTATGWLIKATAVQAGGASASATNSIEIDGFDAYGWRSADRVVGGAVQPDVEVRVVRRPQLPAAAE
jgi:uncharacterized protein (TIGR02246 family)